TTNVNSVYVNAIAFLSKGECLSSHHTIHVRSLWAGAGTETACGSWPIESRVALGFCLVWYWRDLHSRVSGCRCCGHLRGQSRAHAEEFQPEHSGGEKGTWS